MVSVRLLEWVMLSVDADCQYRVVISRAVGFGVGMCRIKAVLTL